MTPDDIRRTFQTLRPPPDDPERLREDVADALIQARKHPELAADWRIAEAALQHPDALFLLQQALQHLGAERRAERAYVHEQLSQMRAVGGDQTRAREHLRAALELTRGSNRVDQTRLALRLGCALMVAGLPQEAEPMLREASRAAALDNDTLIQLGTATVLAALRLEAGDPEGAIAYGAQTAMIGAQRGNWIAVADGLITQSAAHQQQSDWSVAMEIIIHGSERLQEAHALAALNLLRAHLVEMRQALGEDEFDALFQGVIEPRQVEEPLQKTQ